MIVFKKTVLTLSFTLFLVFPISQWITCPAFAQFGSMGGVNIEEDDLNLGGDIFTDFQEDLEEGHVLEAMRFYNYGRFFSFSLTLGVTQFTGNRGLAYQNDHPSYGMALHYFFDLQNSFVMGFAFSRHHFILNRGVHAYRVDFLDNSKGAGLVNINMLRTFFGLRYYIDTSNLGTAITYSNPYFTGRMEYWYTSTKFADQDARWDHKGGALGIGIGGGLEFPIRIKESYFGLELLYHRAGFKDKDTQNYRPIEGESYGWDDMRGDVVTFMISYIMSW